MLTGCGASVVQAGSPGTLVASSSTLSFGTVTVGQSAAAGVSLVNSGTTPVAVSKVSLNGQAFALKSENAAPVTVAAGQSYALQVQFSPTAEGSATGQLTVVSDASGGTSQIALNGMGKAASSGTQGPQAPALTVSASSIDFSAVAVNTPATRTMTIRSTGTAPLTISAAAVTGAGFSVGGTNFPLTLEAGQSASLNVQFTPAAAGAATGALTLTSDSSTGGKTSIALSGTGMEAEAGLLNGISCKYDTVTGAVEDDCTVTLTGPAPSSGLSVGISSSDSSVAVPSTLTIQPHATSASFVASVSPVSTAKTAVLSARGGSIWKNYWLRLNPGDARLTVSTTALDFGNVPLNTDATQSFTVSSTGYSRVTVTGGSITGKGFSATADTFSLSLDPGRSVTVTVHFRPTTAGTVNGALTIQSNSATGARTVIALTGTGGSPSAVLSGIGCSNASITGAATDACTVQLSGPAPAGGVLVGLSSSNASVSVPASVRIPAGSDRASFAATAAAVSSTETAVLSARAGSVSKAATLTLNPAAAKLTLSSTTVAFGNVTVKTTASETVTLTASGGSAVTISGAQVSGRGFSVASRFPLTLQPGQSAVLTVQFAPISAGATMGTLVLNSNASGGAQTIALSGTGETNVVLSSLTCGTATLTGAGTDLCTVSLSGPAGSGGVAVQLGSSSSSVKVPGSVTIPANATSATFTAAASAVTSTQTITLGAQAGSVTKTTTLTLSPGGAKLTVSSTALDFGSVTLQSTASKTVTLTASGTVTVSAAAVSGTGFSVSGAGFPLTLESGQSATLTIQFAPTAAGAVTGALVVSSNAAGGAQTVALSGTGATNVVLSSISCSTTTLSGAATDVCTVSLSGPAGSGGVAVQLGSSSSSVKVPASVTIPARATSATFTATASAVTSTQTVTLGAQAGSVTKTMTLTLGTGARILTLDSSTISFGSVKVGSSTTQSVTLTSSGTAALTISAASLTGKGFSMSGVSFPMTLNAGQSVTLDLTFDPTAAGAAAGTLTLTSNATAGSTTSIALTGTGTALSYAVSLSWDAPTSTVEGYYIYRAVSGSSSYTRLNGSPESATDYEDSSVTSGTAYSYEVTSVDSNGLESSPSNIFTVTIP